MFDVSDHKSHTTLTDIQHSIQYVRLPSHSPQYSLLDISNMALSAVVISVTVVTVII